MINLNRKLDSVEAGDTVVIEHRGELLKVYVPFVEITQHRKSPDASFIEHKKIYFEDPSGFMTSMQFGSIYPETCKDLIKCPSPKIFNQEIGKNKL